MHEIDGQDETKISVNAITLDENQDIFLLILIKRFAFFNNNVILFYRISERDNFETCKRRTK